MKFWKYLGARERVMKELKKKNAGKYSHLTEQKAVKTRTYI